MSTTDPSGTAVPAPRSATGARRNWTRIALVTAGLFVVGSIPYLGCSLTFGLISGLVVVLIPLYVALAHTALVTIVVSLALGRGWHGIARGAGALVALGPGLGIDGWYAREWWRCAHAPSPAACFQYLNGSPLLPIGVGVYTVFSLVMLGAVLALVGQVARSARAVAPGADASA